MIWWLDASMPVAAIVLTASPDHVVIYSPPCATSSPIRVWPTSSTQIFHRGDRRERRARAEKPISRACPEKTVPTRKNPRFCPPQADWKCLILLCVLRGLCGQTETFGIIRLLRRLYFSFLRFSMGS